MTGPAYTRRQCWLCWTRAYSPRHAPAKARPGKCAHLGKPTGEKRACPTCTGGRVELKLFACAVHGSCTPATKLKDVACCRGCPDHQPPGCGPSAPGD